MGPDKNEATKEGEMRKRCVGKKGAGIFSSTWSDGVTPNMNSFSAPVNSSPSGYQPFSNPYDPHYNLNPYPNDQTIDPMMDPSNPLSPYYNSGNGSLDLPCDQNNVA